MKHASPKDGSDSEGKDVHGYLVEVTPGRELLYRTPWAFREAIRIGQITAESRIFHRAKSQWISITEHPEYRKFMSERSPLPPPGGRSGPAASSPSGPTRQSGPKSAPAAPTPPISQKAAGLYQRMTLGLTELKRRLETAKPKRSVQQPQPRSTPSPPARSPAVKPIARKSAPAPSNAVSKTPPSSTPPASAESEESSQAPQSPPSHSGPRDRWTFYP
jgi:hypothetical protein